MSLVMLPIRKSTPVPRRFPAVAVEVRVPSLGSSFGALAASIRPEGVFLSTFQELAVGTVVVASLSLPDGQAIVDGVVVAPGDPTSPGIAVQFDEVDDIMRMRLSAAASVAPPPSGIRVA